MISTGADPITAVAIAKALAQGDTLTAASYMTISSGMLTPPTAFMTPTAKLVTASLQQANKTVAELSISNVVDTRQSDNYNTIRSMVNAQNKEGQ